MKMKVDVRDLMLNMEFFIKTRHAITYFIHMVFLCLCLSSQVYANQSESVNQSLIESFDAKYKFISNTELNVVKTISLDNRSGGIKQLGVYLESFTDDFFDKGKHFVTYPKLEVYKNGKLIEYVVNFSSNKPAILLASKGFKFAADKATYTLKYTIRGMFDIVFNKKYIDFKFHNNSILNIKKMSYIIEFPDNYIIQSKQISSSSIDRKSIDTFLIEDSSDNPIVKIFNIKPLSNGDGFHVNVAFKSVFLSNKGTDSKNIIYPILDSCGIGFNIDILNNDSDKNIIYNSREQSESSSDYLKVLLLIIFLTSVILICFKIIKKQLNSS